MKSAEFYQPNLDKLYECIKLLKYNIFLDLMYSWVNVFRYMHTVYIHQQSEASIIMRKIE